MLLKKSFAKKKEAIIMRNMHLDENICGLSLTFDAYKVNF